MRIWDCELISAKKPEYVTDGLLLWLDGVNNTRNGHDTTSTVWEDLSGNNYDFSSQNGNAVWGADHCAFNGTFYLEGAYVFYSAYTVEVCYQSNNTQLCIFTSGGNQVPANNPPGSPGIFENNAQIGFGRMNGFGTLNAAFFQKPSNLLSISYGNQTTINGTVCSAVRTGTLNETREIKSRIGNRLDGSTKYRNAFKLFSVRFYNRVLSLEEIAQNYAVDKLRFGVGGD